MIKIASLFSGIGGFELGIQQAADKLNIDIGFVFASEFDPDSKAKNMNKQPSRQIYRKNFNRWPEGDITKINASDVPGHDILVAGPPCQGFSIAGKREGLCGAKGSMFFELFRIVREKQPELIFIENVKGILSSNRGWDFARILIELENAGYWVEWQVLDTAAFLPQRRERVFIIGHLAGTRGNRQKIFPIRKTGKLVDEKQSPIYTIDANYYKGPARQSRTMILCDSGPGRKSQIRDETIAPLRANTGAGHNNVVCHSTLPRNSTSGNGGTGHLQRNDGLSYCCDAANNIAIESGQRIRRLTPIEVEKLQGFPANWTAEGIYSNGNTVKISDTQRYKCLGNAVSVPVIKFIAESLLKIRSDIT